LLSLAHFSGLQSEAADSLDDEHVAFEATLRASVKSLTRVESFSTSRVSVQPGCAPDTPDRVLQRDFVKGDKPGRFTTLYDLD
jgi:hypothetical protein